MTTLEAIAAAYRMGKQVVVGLCSDLTTDEFFHQPVPGANSAAWIVGHLALTAKRTAERLGAKDLPELNEEFVARFKATRVPAREQSGIGDKAELLSLLELAVEKLMEAVRTSSPQVLTGPLTAPAPPWVTNSGEMLVFGAMHFTLHAGQISTIRRSLGKPPMV